MPYVYDFHVELITAIKKLGELDQLRHAREAMHLVYPLSEGMCQIITSLYYSLESVFNNQAII